MARPEQTEKPTPKRQGEARAKGQVARSHDLSGAAIFLAIVISLHMMFASTMGNAAGALIVAYTHAGTREALNMHSVWGLFGRSLTPYVFVLMITFASAVVIGLVANILQFGFLFAPALLQPNFSKLNPLGGLKNLFFSVQTLIQLAKNIAKLSAVGLIVYMTVKDHVVTVYALATAAPHDIIVAVEGMLYTIGVRFGIFLLVLGAVDFFWEKKRLENSLKMSKTEVREETKQAETSPEVRQAVRQRQRATARRRMMAAVPRATVVVTNPTHFAVALEWDDVKMEAPVVTAKGADLMARRIREMAREHGVPILENPPLARSLYDKVEIDSPVPPNLYAAVAEIIAFVYKLKGQKIS